MKPDLDKSISLAAEQFDTPFYLYFPELIEDKINLVRKTCPGMGIRYAVKTNPNPWLLSWLQERVDSLDISSSGELALAINAGWKSRDLEFTGPAKTEADLKNALELGVESIVVEDISEARLLNKLCGQLRQKKRILVRIQPGKPEEKFAVRLAGRVSQFGVDEETLPEFIDAVKKLDWLEVDGFHIYSGSQCLDDEALAAHFWSMWMLFSKAITLLGTPVSELVFGAGMGIPYHEGDQALTLEALAPISRKIMQETEQYDFPLRCFIEVGRFLVGEAGFFVTRVIRVKRSLNKKVAICDGGMNHNLGACGHLGGFSHRHYNMRLISKSPSDDTDTYRIVGPLCTAIDTLAHSIVLPEIIENDLIAVGCSGSYGPSSSPLYFISHKFPHEIVKFSGDDTMQDISWLGKTPLTDIDAQLRSQEKTGQEG